MKVFSLLLCLMLTLAQTPLEFRAAVAAGSGTPPSVSKKPTTMVGLPMLPVIDPASVKKLAPPPFDPNHVDTMLDEVGRMPASINPEALKRWQKELASIRGHGQKENTLRARLNLQLGEGNIGREEPDIAEGYLARAIKLGGGPEVQGLARYDLAVARIYEGKFEEARHEFRVLLRSRYRGFNRRNAAIMASHASACAGYHQSHLALGIPQPSRLDPLCGVSGLAIFCRANGMRFDEAYMSKMVPHHGQGSSAQDLLEGCKNLGLSGHVVTSDDQGLILLPKPFVAHIERDHFVSVTSADKNGVTYVCSDCGPWPGGRVRLSWKQWKSLDPDAYVIPTKKGSAIDMALSALDNEKRGYQNTLLAAVIPQQSAAGVVAQARNILAAIRNHVVAFFFPEFFLWCGWKPDGGHCPTCPCHGPMCPLKSVVTPRMGSVYGDPINLATGEEEYEPEPDLVVYNPIGPSVDWQRLYNSLSNWTSGFGCGWSDPYNVGVEDYNGGSPSGTTGWLDTAATGSSCAVQTTGTTYNGRLILSNGSRIGFSCTIPTSGTPTTTATVSPGYPVKIECNYTSSTTHNYVITFADRTKWVTASTGYVPGPNGNTPYTQFLPLASLSDRNGNSLQFVYGSYANVWNEGINVPAIKRLTEIDDSNGSWLLKLDLDTNGNITCAHDRYGRAVYYNISNIGAANVSSPNQQTFPLVDQVSQIVSYGTLSRPMRFSFTYANYTDREWNTSYGAYELLPSLHTISVPSPTGTGTSTATINYSSLTGYVSDVVDAHGNKTVVTPDPSLHRTRVDVKDSSGTTVYTETVDFDSNMNETALMNAAGHTVFTRSFGGSSPFRPSSVTDANSRTWTYTWDGYSNLLTATTPKNITTTYTRSYSNFVLGELTDVQVGSHTASHITYNEPSGLVATVATPIPGNTSGSSSTQTTGYTWDTLGNLTQVQTPGNNSTTYHTVNYGYTTDGTYTQSECLGEPITITDSLSKVTHLRYDSRGNVTSATDALGNQVQASYNNANDPTAITLPPTGNTGTGNAVEMPSYLYVGGPVTQEVAKDESGTTVRTMSFTYGAEGELLSRSGAGEAVSLTYDPLYRTHTLSDGASNATTYTYDTTGRLTEVDYPGATGTYTDKVQYTSYDDVNNLLTRFDGNGQETDYTYGDTDGLLSAVTYPGATSNNLSFTYDSYDRMTALTDATGSAAVSSSDYDDLNNVLASSRTYTGLSAKTFNYTFYPDGSRHTMVNPAGTWTYYYDADGRYASMSSPVGTSYATYFDNGWQSTRTLPDGAETDYTYNAVGALTDLLNKTSGGTTLSHYNSFTYDGIFETTGLTASVPATTSQGGATTWSYTTLNQLQQESSARSGGYTQNFAFDSSGNPTTFKGATQSFNGDNQQTGTGFAYDGNGSPTTYKGTTLTFDPENRMTGLGSSWSASYRADGLRASKTVSGTKTYYLYDGGEPVCEFNSSGTLIAYNVFAPDGLVARRKAAFPTWTEYTFDQQGNVAQRLDGSQSIITSSYYDAFGVENTTGTPTDQFGYNGQSGYYLDRETGLYLCQNRYFDPASGCWITRDPIDYDGGINVYGYCEGNPIGQSDSNGLWLVIKAPPGVKAIIVSQLRQIEKFTPIGRQLVYDLVYDKKVYEIDYTVNAAETWDWMTPPRLQYDPIHSIICKGAGPRGTGLSMPPDVQLEHELGHLIAHRKDPRPGQPGKKGDNVYDVENPYRRFRHLPRRERY